jgi:YqaJ-like viral recombinase domain
MALNAAQIARRTGKLTGSRIACLMTGDRDKIMQLYNEFIGEALPESLDHIWAVRLGECTEQLQMDWYEEKHRQSISRRGEVINHMFLDWAAVTVDGWIDAMECPIEVKHVGGREPLEVIFERYAPQTQWQMECTGADQCALSVIMGASEPVVEFLERDQAYITEMLKRGAQFMQCVRERRPPVELPAVPAPAMAEAIYDMRASNEWGHYANIWRELRMSADAYDEAAKILKSLVPLDAKKAHGHGVQITRNRAGSLSLREMKE